MVSVKDMPTYRCISFLFTLYMQGLFPKYMLIKIFAIMKKVLSVWNVCWGSKMKAQLKH